jgi:hypothetical protein
LDVPPEVVQAAETGSGWSGRSVPMLVFLAGEDALAQAVLRAFDRCALKHLVRVNYGDEPYTVAPVPLAETLMGGGEGGQPQPGAPQPGGNGGAGGGQWVPYQGARGGRGGRNADTGAVRYLSLSGGPGPVIDPAVRERVIRRIEAAEG